MIAINRNRLRPPFAPMEAQLVSRIPTGAHWQYEPKWDGFHCLAFRNGSKVDLQSKSGQPLGRYFPEIVEAIGHLKAQRYVLDGEIVVPTEEGLSFDALLLRIHPAASRIRMLAAQTPARLIAFDFLQDYDGTVLLNEVLKERRAKLERFATRFFKHAERMALSPKTADVRTARRWFRASGDGIDGILAKRMDMPYLSGERTAMVKIKRMRTADCVVAGFRYGSKATRTVGSLLLGLYDADGLLHHVGFTSSLSAAERRKLTPKLRKLRLGASKGGGFTGRAPGGPSRWSTERSGAWESLAPRLVVEVQYDHFSGGRFRHGTKFLRWRPEKAPRQCTMNQVAPPTHVPAMLRSM